MNLIRFIRDMISNRHTLTSAGSDRSLQAFALSLEGQDEGDLLDLLSSLPRHDAKLSCPDSATKRILVLTRLHRLTMEAEASNLPT